MAFEVTQKEVEYQATTLLAGQTYTIFLANAGSLNGTSTIAQWEAAALPEQNGYTAVTGTIGTGTYNSVSQRVLFPIINGTFGPILVSDLQFSAIVVKIGSRIYPYALKLYEVTSVISVGGTRSFSLTIGIQG